ncbi:hypothetical protein J2X36_005228 [Methylobacterium sp. BE186]|uniref:hypothetical protein n=1 Tax=Methylobacterium sp. BE186 TaxID=2817715 RepID=UPI002862408F|nr:hypothetical protein [Methylobacterium sp. BE186]MDR7040445.1 hypothetical protein [Methylobacterium sp. BE186]
MDSHQKADQHFTAEPKRTWLAKFWRGYTRILHAAFATLVGATILVLGVLFVNYVVLSTPKARAYRDLDPAVPECSDGLARGWTVLADTGRRPLAGTDLVDDGGWIDASNDENAAAASDPRWRTRFRCALQRHIVTAERPDGKPLDYTLGFLEFQEDGEPYALVSRSGGSDVANTSAMLRHAMESQMRASGRAAAGIRPVITQLDALKQHLSSGANYVLVFVHGWRHDARIGDGNVADLRLYAAHVARFLQQRCPTDPRACETKVTAIYVGWRGARVDEQGLRDLFGDAIGGFLGDVSAAATLFDRKPVSEAIAPAAISALRSIESVLATPRPDGSQRNNRLIVAGHSLGGNMLATGLKDDVLKAVRRHAFGKTLPPVLGNLVVLINPASEASKWTTVQRAVWERIALRADENTPAAEIVRDTGFFPPEQRPVMISVTAALAFPAGGLRPGDCAWIGLDIDDGYQAARQRIRQRLASTDAMFHSGVDYDWATHDLFPTFKLDFRPAGGFLDRVAARFEGRQPRGMTCTPPRAAAALHALLTLPLRALAVIAETFPFQVSLREESHTIGNLDPPRPAAGVLADTQPSAAPFGTTHELLGLHDTGRERHHAYATLADASIDCPRSDGWLTRARMRKQDHHGQFWDSEDLALVDPARPGFAKPAARFVHGLHLTGIAPITLANDPFWNMRAFDNALSRHDGYRLSSFICAMNQLVLDDITESTPQMIDTMGVPGVQSSDVRP